MEKEKPNALEMGKEKAQTIKEKNEKTRRRTLTRLYYHFCFLFLLLHLVLFLMLFLVETSSIDSSKGGPE